MPPRRGSPGPPPAPDDRHASFSAKRDGRRGGGRARHRGRDRCLPLPLGMTVLLNDESPVREHLEADRSLR
ncbi:MAG: hypothetical protein ACRD2A_05465, partial [Vicinamibacterales bacterium]